MKAIILSLLALASVASARAGFFRATEKFVQSYAVSQGAELALSNVNGSIEIVAWDKNEVLVEAEKQASCDEDLPKLAIIVEASPTRVSVRTEHQKTGWFGRNVKGSVSYVIHVPASIALREISSVNSGIKVSGVSGEIDARTVNGGIKVVDALAPVRLKTVNGGIDASVQPSTQPRTIRLHTVNGGCRLTLPSGISASLDASTVNGGVHCSLPVTIEKSGRHYLKGRIGQDAQTQINVETVNGGIDIETK